MSSASSDPAAPTAPRPVDAQGHDLDEWGLPISGPARVRRLAELGKPDPNIDPAGWRDEPGLSRSAVARARRAITGEAGAGEGSAEVTENGNG